MLLAPLVLCISYCMVLLLPVAPLHQLLVLPALLHPLLVLLASY